MSKSFDELRSKMSVESRAESEAKAKKLLDLMPQQEEWSDRQKEIFAELIGWNVDIDYAHELVGSGLSPETAACLLGETERPKPQSLDELMAEIEKEG